MKIITAMVAAVFEIGRLTRGGICTGKMPVPTSLFWVEARVFASV